jgi:hypothetical protein
MDIQDQYKPILYQKIEPNASIQKYTIIGERHSGTNWLEKIFTYHFNVPLTWEFGSKHFIDQYDPNKLASANNCLFMCITRNIYDWIGGFYKLPHHVDPYLQKDLETFMLSEWKGEIQDNDYFLKKPYKNIFSLRKYKLEFLYVYLPFLVNNLLLIRYEDLLKNTGSIIDFIENNFSIKTKNKHLNKLTKPKIKHAYKFTKKHISIIYNNTDWQTEKVFHYFPRTR